jgi:predicted outer membrane repeat protein
VTLSAGSNGYIFRASSVSDVVLAGFTLKNGYTVPSTYYGGAMVCVGSGIELHDVVIEDSYANESGGGMYCSDSDVLLEGVVFRNNRCRTAGGGLYCSGCDVTLSDCVFESNEVGNLQLTQTTWSYRGKGAGMHCEGGSSMTAEDVAFTSNYTWYEGAGLCLRGEGTSAELTGCVFTNNTTSTDEGYMGAEQRGAALSVTNGAEVVLDDVKFARNWSYLNGGAVYCAHAHVTLDECVFTECEAGSDGGAILAFRGADVTATGCLFIRNLAGGRGGALYMELQGSEVPVDLSYCIFAGNSADGGGAVFSFRGQVLLSGCTLVENEARHGSAVRAYPWGTATVANCILSYGAGGHVVSGDVEVTHCCVLEPEPGSWLCGEPYENICADPLFCPSRVRDFTLCSNSPCLPQNNEWGELIGAAGQGCGPCNSAVLETSWGSIKAMFRGD